MSNQTVSQRPKPGRPRLDADPEFVQHFATVLPRLRAGEISQSQAARKLGISIRSLKRYAIQAEVSPPFPKPRRGVRSRRG